MYVSKHKLIKVWQLKPHICLIFQKPQTPHVLLMLHLPNRTGGPTTNTILFYYTIPLLIATTIRLLDSPPEFSSMAMCIWFNDV